MINQLFTSSPNTEIIIKCLNAIGWHNIDDTRVFIRTDLDNANVANKVKLLYPELKDIYIPCKHYKYLRCWTTKSVITIARQLLKTIGWTIIGIEKVINNKKNMVYKLTKNKNNIHTTPQPIINRMPAPKPLMPNPIPQQTKFIVVWN